LTDEIGRTMPLGNTGDCTGTTPGSCAYDVASLLLDEISSTIINPGITIINPNQVRNTTEDGGMASIQMRLDTAPTADVNIDFSSSLVTEGTVNPSRLTFTAANYSALQTVMVTGVPDFVVDGDTMYTVITAPAQSADTDYAGMNPADITITNIDNAAAPAVTVNPVTGLVTDENGTAVTFSVVLSSVAPTSNVLIDVTSLNTAEGLVSVAPNAPAASTTLTFTPADYNVQQFVTVTGQDDALLDGNQAYTVSVNMNGGTQDPRYAAIDPSDVMLTNNDNEVPPVIGVVVNPTNGLVTTEAGQGTDTFTIRLESNPVDNVTIPLSSSDPTEGTVSPASVTFTPANGIVQQTITVTGVDDAIDDNDIAYTIITGDPTSAGDANFDALNAGDVADVSVTNTDDDLSQLELGQQLYRTVFNTNDANVTESCESCHGATGLGGTTVFPVAPGACLLGNCNDEASFSAYTFTNMPRDSGALIGIGAGEMPTMVCDQACSDAIAAYVFNGFSTTPSN
jgi:mono/diheme cytochrome c family protein